MSKLEDKIKEEQKKIDENLKNGNFSCRISEKVYNLIIKDDPDFFKNQNVLLF